jgi:hypothetical protein
VHGKQTRGEDNRCESFAKPLPLSCTCEGHLIIDILILKIRGHFVLIGVHSLDTRGREARGQSRVGGSGGSNSKH